ncbi:hypothetical protein [Pedobacter helvus]|uniref:Helicase C-terminal domain-containing protein n=1 Tax=Pedobacter helvus TaxID=2563444 RepID=A0ABW9JCL0_9SPHI|nr:hypothetical protein [Pedobacter ureilyticus]
MKVKIKKIGKHQYLSDIMKELARNCIYHKPTGAGITTLELRAKRHGVIIEVNTPVIQGKCLEFNRKNRRKLLVRGVYEGIAVDEIIDYLQSDVEYKKIITTPESYPKVVQAFEELGITDEFYKTYFMLFDECERTIQDVNYRKSIILPMEDFFKFKNKAFVSATPIIPTDPRFKVQKFQYVKIEPDYDCKQDVEITITNNTILSFKKHIEESCKKQYFIFLNSTKSICTVINFLNIDTSKSYIFCSEESRNKLKLNGVTNAKSTLVESKEFREFNFFTSRFNSAVDILGVEEPHIIIITDLFLASHTKVDPCSEVIQIVGRFRRPQNGEIVRHLFHITNIDPTIPFSTEEEILADIERLKVVYETLNSFCKAGTNVFAKTIVLEMIEKTAFADFVNKNGTTNYFMIDNAVFENKINSYYSNSEKLIDAYNNSKEYSLSVKHENYLITDKIKSDIKLSHEKLKSSLELLLPILNDLEQQGLSKPEVVQQIDLIRKDHPTAFRTFEEIGFDKAKELGFKYHKIKAEIANVKLLRDGNNFEFLSHIKRFFKVGKSYTLLQIKSTLREGVKKYNLPSLKPSIELLEKYFYVSSRTYIETVDGKKVYGYTLLGSKF